MLLTTSQFTHALNRQLEESKPDLLAKKQIESLCIKWDQNLRDGDVDSSGAAGKKTGDSDFLSLHGTLDLSSDYISISINVNCQWSSYAQGVPNHGKCSPRDDCDNTDTTKQFQEEFFIRLTASASESKVTSNDTTHTHDRKERKATKKLRTEMIKRLRADHYIKKLFVDEKANADPVEYVPLCEALIQRNLGGSGGKSADINDIHELEERVHVQEETLQGIKNSLFSQTEDNLDVLELILNMPYLPRSPSKLSDSGKTESSLKEWHRGIAERAYLRLLEDAMFDACEKEGEDEILDDLNISGVDNDQSINAESCSEMSRRYASSKRTRNS